MKKLILGIIMLGMMFSCEKEVIEPEIPINHYKMTIECFDYGAPSVFTAGPSLYSVSLDSVFTNHISMEYFQSGYSYIELDYYQSADDTNSVYGGWSAGGHEILDFNPPMTYSNDLDTNDLFIINIYKNGELVLIDEGDIIDEGYFIFSLYFIKLD